jgi:uncharacterized protein YggE
MEGIIRITASEKRDISAKNAKLHIKLEAERIGFGNATWQQSREVRELVGKLKHLGLEENQISFASVRASSPGGLLKASRAEFHLVISCSLETIAAVLDALSESKNTELWQLEWLWEDFETQLELAAQAMQKAKRKAEAMATAAQCQVVGVRSASDSHTLPEAASSFHESFAKAPAMSRRADMSVGMEYRATTTLEVTVTAEFIVLPV